MLRIIKHKALLLIGALVVCAAILAFTGALQFAVARASSSIYVAVHYPDRHLKFDSAGYIPVIDEYCVTYKDKEGTEPALGLWLTPKEFPFAVFHDSIKGEA